MEALGILEVLLRTGTFVLGIAVFIATFFTRRVVELLVPSSRQAATDLEAAPMYATTWSRWWNGVVLYAVPVAYGMLAGLSHNEYLFGPMHEAGVVCVMFGGGVGWFSSFLYKLVRKAAVKRLGLSDSILPPEA